MNCTNTLKSFTVVMIFILISCNCIFGQTYSDRKFKITPRPLPPVFTMDFGAKAESLAANQDIVDKKLAIEAYTKANYYTAEVLQSGLVYVNDEFTIFLEKILDELLKNDPALKDDIYIIALKKSTANAALISNGIIMVNIGLIIQLENASQLASVLAHEINHYKKQHSLRKKLNDNNFNKDESLSEKAGIFRILQYSKEFEYEADAAGLIMLNQTSFDSREASSALFKMNESEYQDTLKTELSTLLNSSLFKIDTALFRSKLINKELKKHVKQSYSIIKGNEDAGKTHPDLEKRALAIKEILQSLDYTARTSNLEIEFQEIRKKAQYEDVINLFNSNQYLYGLHKSLLLLENDTNSMEASELVVKNLYSLCRYKENGIITEYFNKVDLQKNRTLAMLKILFSQTDSKELGKMLYLFTKKQYEKFNNSEDLLFYLGASAELHLGKDAARIQFRNYSIKFPDGIYQSYVSQKIG